MFVNAADLPGDLLILQTCRLFADAVDIAISLTPSNFGWLAGSVNLLIAGRYRRLCRMFADTVDLPGGLMTPWTSLLAH